MAKRAVLTSFTYDLPPGRHTLYPRYVDYMGNLVIDYQYTRCFDFSEGLARVTTQDGRDALYGFINTQGEMVIEEAFEFDWQRFSDGLAYVSLPDGTKCFIDRSGAVAFRLEDGARTHGFSEGLAAIGIWEEGAYRYRYIDTSGEWVIDAVYEEASDFKDGLAFVSSGNGKGFINRKGEMVISLPKGYSLCFESDFHEGLLIVR